LGSGCLCPASGWLAPDDVVQDPNPRSCRSPEDVVVAADHPSALSSLPAFAEPGLGRRGGGSNRSQSRRPHRP
jgi:hypothetical protein